jgi:glycosyltransferase involved in cell wall biosynthesis
MVQASIILLTKNGLPLLEESLSAIFAQKSDRSFEVLAIDSGSSDGTLELLKRYPIRVEQIPAAEFNFGATRGMGYDLAQGQILVALSQDAVPADDRWLDKLVAPFDDPTVAAVRGGQALPPSGGFFYWERAGRFYFTRPSVRWRARYGFGFSNVNSAIRKEVWEQNRIERAEMAEDRLLQKMWAERHLKIVLALDATVYHSHHYHLQSLALRSENEGLGLRLCGQEYSLIDACFDAMNLDIWRWWVKGCLKREISAPAEILFPIVRPLFMWKGNRFTERYVNSR